jgi:hypothetical protein
MQNLNRDIRVPFGDEEFDGVGICVSIDYLTWPIEVLQHFAVILTHTASVHLWILAKKTL